VSPYQKDADAPASLYGESLAETIELPIRPTNTALERARALEKTSDAEFLGDWEIGGESQALLLYFQATQFAQDAINQATGASNGGPARPGRAAVTPRFAWVCSTVLDYSVACLMLDKKIEPDENTAWAHDTSFTFGQISKHDIVIIYHPLESKDAPEYSDSGDILQNLFKHRFDSVELILLVGTGGAIPGLSPNFDIRLGDIVVGETVSMSLNLKTWKFGYRGQLSWWVRQAVAKLELDPLVTSPHSWYFTKPKEFPNVASDEFKYPGPQYDKLYFRSYLHQGPRVQDCKACDTTKIDVRQSRYNVFPAVHLGNAFVSEDGFGINSMSGISHLLTIKEWTSKPLVLTRNGATVVAAFPCIIICGVSNYFDTHDQTRWKNYAAFKAAQYAKRLVRDM
jgi:hypothetical protein